MIFMCIQATAHGQTSYRYWFDNNHSSLQEGNSLSNQFLLDPDVNKLTNELHTFHIQVANKEGVWSSPMTRMFVKVPSSDNMGALKLVYSIDGIMQKIKNVSYTNGVININLDVADISNGIHSVSYMLMDENGMCTNARTSMFVKVPSGGNSVARYDYWVNDNYTNNKTVIVTNKENPYNLVVDLEVSPEPIRSSCFHFEVIDNVPMMFAMNDIGIRFYDDYNQSTYITKQYIDVNASKKITDLSQMQSKQTFARVKDKEVKWFVFRAVSGDTISLKASQALTMQLFEPDGNVVYSTTGSDATVFGGCRLGNTGLYYIAIHDITGTQTNVTLECNLDSSLGDADGDGFVTMADAKLVVDGFLGRKTKYINVKAADVNGDGKVTMADANAIVNICLGRK